MTVTSAEFCRDIAPSKCALANAAAAEQTDTLALSAGQHAVDYTHTSRQRFVDRLTGERIRRRCVQVVRCGGLQPRPIIHGLSEPIEHAAKKIRSDADAAIFRPRDDRRAQLKSVGLFQRDREHPPFTETRDLRANRSARAGFDLTEISERHSRPSGFDQHSYYVGDLARPLQRVGVGDVIQIWTQIHCDAVIGSPAEAVGKTALDFLELRFYRGVEIPSLRFDNESAGLQGRIGR